MRNKNVHLPPPHIFTQETKFILEKEKKINRFENDYMVQFHI